MTEQAGVLQRRLIAAAVLVPAAVVWALFAPLAVFAAIGAVLLLIGAWEWAALSGLSSDYSRGGFLLIALVLMALSWWALYSPAITTILLFVFLAFWLAAGLELGRGRIAASRPFFLLHGLWVLVPAWFAFVALRLGPDGPELVLALLAIVWAADAGAYFAGRQWGRRKLAPRISPGKSWEGLAGGLVGGVVAALIASLWCKTAVTVLVPLAVVTVVFSVLGDLLESRLKRAAGAKDSGRIIPGHGGLLDRIDSLCAAAPIFALGIQVASMSR
jgi:phosphatidate cytidylyltransferase